MRFNRILLSTVLVVVALVVQVSVLARLHLPGAVPDLLLLTVLGLALVYGHVGGALVGFGAGLLADLAPPADHAAGRYALVLCVIGYLAGLAKPENGRLRSATGPMVVVVAAAIGTTLLYAGVGALVGPRPQGRGGPPPHRPPPSVPRCRPPRRRPRPPPCRPPQPAVHGRPVRPPARPLRRPRHHGARPARRERPARRDRLRGQLGEHLLRVAVLGHRSEDRQPAGRPREPEDEGTGPDRASGPHPGGQAAVTPWKVADRAHRFAVYDTYTH